MALVVYDRVQETTATTGTGSITLGGAVTGYQSFAVIGNGNTTFYCILNGAAWEVGVGTYSTTGPTLARTTILSNSNGNTSPITLSGASNVFVTYPSEKSVNLDASGNVTALGTITSAVWNGTTIPVAYGGTGVTASSGANSVVLRDANQNITANNISLGYTSTVSAAGTTTLTVASTYYQRITGTSTQTIKLPDATTISNGRAFIIDNDSTQSISIIDNASGAVDTIVAGTIDMLILLDNSTIAGTWIAYGWLPANYDFGTTSANFGGSTISNATWNGNTVGVTYGGTGLNSISAANYAIYSSGVNALTAGTLPTAAGGTGLTSYTAGDLPYYASGTALSKLGIGTSGYVLQSNGSAPTWVAASSVVGGAAGSNTQIQYNNSGALGASSTFVYSSGNVGIGTTSPSTKLTVGSIATGTIEATYKGNIRIEGTETTLESQGGLEFKMTSDGYGAKIQTLSSGGTNLVFATRNSSATWSERMRINSSGNVLIGQTSSSNKLAVTSATNYGFSITDGTYSGIFTPSGLGGIATGVTSNHPYIIITNNAERMRIHSSGGVSIGNTTDPGATNLSVTGTVTASNHIGAGTGLTGTASGLSIGGNAATATTATYLNSAASSTSVGDISGGNRVNSGFYENSAPTTATGWPVTGSWYHLHATTHSNAGNYYSMQFSASFFSNDLYYRSTNGTGNTAWNKVALQDLSGAINLNTNTISTSYTIPTGSNGLSAGPITIATGVTVTVSTGSTWVIA